jgi:hypothetical protein
MLVVLMWIALFLDVLESFCPMIPRVGPPIKISSSSSLSTTSSTTQEHHTTVELDSYTNVTVKLPFFFHNNTDDDVDSDPSSSSSSSSSSLHDIYIRPLLSDEEVNMACKLAEDYAEENGRWDQPDSERHESYSTCDFPVDECTELETFLESSDFERRLFQQFSDLYNVDVNDLSYNDLFVAYYQGKEQHDNDDDDNEDGDDIDVDFTNSNIMDRLELHRDGSLLSFSLLLNPPNEFEGGGTFYDALRDVKPTFEDGGILHPGGAIRPNRAGDAVLHCGKILHGADVVKSGRRIVLVGFVDVLKRCIRPGVLGNSCKEWGRIDVAKFRLKRQEKKNHRGWVLNNSRWLKDVTNNAVVRGFVPASSGVIRRADPERCRRRRLEIEDLLLRNIILPVDERGPKDDEYHQFSWDNEGEISILDNELEGEDRI